MLSLASTSGSYNLQRGGSLSACSPTTTEGARSAAISGNTTTGDFAAAVQGSRNSSSSSFSEARILNRYSVTNNGASGSVSLTSNINPGGLGVSQQNNVLVDIARIPGIFFTDLLAEVRYNIRVDGVAISSSLARVSSSFLTDGNTNVFAQLSAFGTGIFDNQYSVVPTFTDSDGIWWALNWGAFSAVTDLGSFNSGQTSIVEVETIVSSLVSGSLSRSTTPTRRPGIFEQSSDVYAQFSDPLYFGTSAAGNLVFSIGNGNTTPPDVSNQVPLPNALSLILIGLFAYKIGKRQQS
jgi:hypothetical protein